MKKITLKDYLRRELAPQRAKRYEYTINNFLPLIQKQNSISNDSL